jgi:hypothetical protein
VRTPGPASRSLGFSQLPLQVSAVGDLERQQSLEVRQQQLRESPGRRPRRYLAKPLYFLAPAREQAFCSLQFCREQRDIAR